MAWSAGTAEDYAVLALTYTDIVGQEYKQELLLAGVGTDTTALDAAQIAAFITHLEVISNCAITRAELRSIALTPFSNNAPKTPGSTTEFVTIDNVGALPFVAQNPLIPSKNVRKTVGIPAPVAGKLIGTGANLDAFSGTDSDSVAVLAFLNRYLVFKYAGNGLYYGGSVSPAPVFQSADFKVVSIDRILEPG